MADKNNYILAGNLHLGTTDFKNESNDIVTELNKIEKAAKDTQKVLDKTGSISGGTSSGRKTKEETSDTKALVLAMQKYKVELEGIKNSYKSGLSNIKEYKSALASLKADMKNNTGVQSFMDSAATTKMTAAQKGLASVYGTVNSALATATGTEKRLTSVKQAKVVVLTAEQQAMKDLALNVQKNKIEIDSLTNSYKSGDLTLDDYAVSLKKVKAEMSGTAGNLTTKATTTPLSVPEKGYLTQWNRVNAAIDGVNKKCKDLNKTSTEVNLSTRKAIQTLLGWDIARQGVYYIVQYLQSTLNTLKDINTYIINIQKVTNQTDAEMQAVQSSASAIASTFGRLTTDYLEALEAFSRLKDLDASKFAGLSLLLQNVGDVTAEVSQETLIATNAGFQLNGNYQELMKTIDAMNEISNNNATTITKMSEAIKVSASTAGAAGLSFNQYIALIGTASAVTQREGSQIGNAMRTMFLTIEQVTSASDNVDTDVLGKAAKAIKSLGVEMTDLKTGQLRDVYSILNDISKVWDGDQITKNQKMMFAQAVGNKRQADIILGIMNNWTMVQKQLDEATNSTGSALKENETYMKSWEAHLNTLVSTVTDKMQQLLNSGDILAVVDAGTFLVNVFGELAPALLAVATAYEILNKKSAANQILSAALNGVFSTGTNIVQSYNANLAKVALSYGKNYTEGLPLIANVKAIGETFASTINPMALFVVGITAAIGIYSIYSASVKQRSEEISKSMDKSLEKIRTLSNTSLGGTSGFSEKLASYIELYNRYIDKTGELGSLTSEEFSKMINSSKELSEELDSVGMSFNDIYKYGNKANGTISDVSETSDKVSKALQLARTKTLLNEIQDFSNDASSLVSSKYTIDYGFPNWLSAVNNLFSQLNFVDTPSIFEKSGSITSFSEALSSLMEISRDDKNKSPNTAEMEMFKSLTSLGDLNLSDTIAEVDKLSIDANNMWNSIEDKGSDEATKWLNVTTNLNSLSTATKQYLSDNYDLVTSVDAIRKSFGDSIMSEKVNSLYNAIKKYSSAVVIANAETKKFIQDSTGNQYTQDDASLAIGELYSTENITDDKKAELEAVVNAYYEAVDEYQKKMEGISDEQYSLGNFDKADKELIDLKHNMLSLIQTYQKFSSVGDETGKDIVLKSLSTYGIGSIEDAVLAYSKLANATRDLSSFTKNLTKEQEDEVSTLLDLIDVSLQGSTSAQELAVQYIETARNADDSESSQSELRKAYLDVAEAMGLSTDATFANEQAIAQLALSNGSLTEADQQRIISQASVSEAAKQSTLLILKYQKAQIEQQIATAVSGGQAGSSLSNSMFTTAQNVKNSTASMQQNFLNLQKVLTGKSTSVMSQTPNLVNVNTGSVASLQRQLASVNQLIGLVENLKVVADKATSSGGGSAGSSASDIAQKALDDTVAAFDDGMTKIEDSIQTAFDTGAITAKEALARITIEMNSIKPTYDSIKAKAKSTWNDIEKSTVDHYENMLGMSKDYSDQVKKDYDSAVSNVEGLQNSIASALEKKYSDQIEKRTKELEDLRDAEIAVHNAEIDRLQAEIDALNDETVSKTNNLSTLQAKYIASQKDDSVIGKKRTAELLKQINDLTKELQISALEDQKTEQSKIIDGIKTKYDDMLDEDSKYYDATLAMLNTANSEAARFALANKLIIEKNTQDILTLLTTYIPEYGGIGQLMGQTLGESMKASITTALDSLSVVYAGTAAIASTYQAQAQEFLNFANSQMIALEGKLASAVATSNAISSASGGSSGGQVTYTPPATTSAFGLAPFTSSNIMDSILSIGNNSIPSVIYKLGKNETTGKYFVKNTSSNAVQWFTREELFKKITGITSSSVQPSYRESIMADFLSKHNTGKYFGNYVPAFSAGGISDQTQLAMLHGTKSRPERILPSNVTKTFDDFVYKFLPKVFGNYNFPSVATGSQSKAISIEPHVTMNNTINSKWDEQNALDNVQRSIVGAIRRAGIK